MRFFFILSLFLVALFAVSSAQICGENEEFRNCATHCEPTCEDKIPTCKLECATSRCQCKDGFARDQGKCIDVRKCK